jgi:hypothetical protein
VGTIFLMALVGTLISCDRVASRAGPSAAASAAVRAEPSAGGAATEASVSRGLRGVAVERAATRRDDGAAPDAVTALGDARGDGGAVNLEVLLGMYLRLQSGRPLGASR